MTALFEAMGVNRPCNWNGALDRLKLAAEQGSVSARLQLQTLARQAGPSGKKRAGGASAWGELRQRIDPVHLFRFGEPRSLSENPRVRVLEQFASAAECRWLIERARERLQPASVIHPGSGGLSYQLARSNSGAEFQVPDMDLVFEAVRGRISAVTGVPLPYFEPTQVLHYAPGQQFRPHFDFMDPANPAYRQHLVGGQRIITFLIYLNERFEGGETDFPDAKLRFKGRTGEAIFWANVDPSGRPDPLTRHAGLPPTSGEKWILSQWIRGRAGQAA
jgi:hypothetical protein